MGYICPWWRPTGGGGFSYGGEERTLNYLAKAYGKMIYASAGDLHSIWGPNVLDINGRELEIDIEVPEDGFDDTNAQNNVAAGDGNSNATMVKGRKTKRVKARGVYSRSGDANAKFYPKPHLTSISTSGMDNLGIQERASYSYKTYNGYQGVTPPTIGSNASMSWGWAYAGSVLRGCSKSGIVTGWTSTANMEGGYDVTVDVLCTNASISNLAMAADQTCAAINNPKITDEAGAMVVAMGIRSAIATTAQEAINAKVVGPQPLNNGIQGFIAKFPGTMANPPAPGAEAPKTPVPDVYKAYVKFSSVIDLCNKVLKDINSGVQMVFDPKSNSPIKTPPGIVSAHPFELLTPGTKSYGDIPINTPGSFTGQPQDLWVGADYIIKQIEMTNAIVINKQSNGGSTRYMSFKGFLDSLFNMFNVNLGKMYNLTCANSAAKGDNTIYIVDFNNIEKIAPNDPSPVRSATCTAKLDGDQTSIFYSLKNPPADVTSLRQGGPSAVSFSKNYGELLKAVGTSANESNISAIREANNTLVAAQIPVSTNYGVPCNWNLSITTDGSNYNYGGVIKHPVVSGTPLDGYDVRFAITSVNHSVSAGDWTTSLSTYARILKP